MAARIPVLLKESPYEVIVGHDIIARTGEFVHQVLTSRKCALITDTNVGPLYAEDVRMSLETAGIKTTVITVQAGESAKALGETERICDEMVAAGLDRGAFVAALGGGVVGDLAGFVASIYYRGIPHVQIPTSVVAQVDSSIGGKTGVNSKAGKNLIGAFHQPALVVSDPAALETLPKREFNEGVTEIIKHAIIRDASMLDELENPEDLDLPSLVARNVKIKARIVAEDEFEKLGLRALLNFGHTIGHAIENSAGYGRLLHGEAISLGVVAALHLSVEKAGLPQADADRIVNLLKTYKQPVILPTDLTTDALIDALRRDKKFEAGEIRFILTEKFGSAFVAEDLTEEDLRNAIDHLRS
jgi:3-dehydroquinate synthase